MSHKNRNRARKLQTATGMAYMTCLQLVNNEISFVPKVESCIIVAKLKEIWGDRYEPFDPKGRPCMCEECDP